MVTAISERPAVGSIVEIKSRADNIMPVVQRTSVPCKNRRMLGFDRTFAFLKFQGTKKALFFVWSTLGESNYRLCVSKATRD